MWVLFGQVVVVVVQAGAAHPLPPLGGALPISTFTGGLIVKTAVSTFSSDVDISAATSLTLTGVNLEGAFTIADGFTSSGVATFSSDVDISAVISVDLVSGHPVRCTWK